MIFGKTTCYGSRVFQDHPKLMSDKKESIAQNWPTDVEL